MTEPTEIVKEPSVETEQPVSLIVAKAADQWLHPLEPYGPAKALREMTRRIMLFDKGKVKMSPTEAAHLAQVAASSWLNPFTGEIWGWVDVYRNERRLNIMPGRKGLIRHAKEQANLEGDKFYPEYEEIVSLDLRRQYLLEEGDLAYICKLRSIREIDTWNASLMAAGQAGLEPSDVKELVGPRPYTFGLGIMRKKEVASTKDAAMTATERCQKRAYMMALKQKYVLPLAHAIGQEGQTVDDYIIEGEFQEVDPEPEGEGKEEEGTEDPRQEEAQAEEPEQEPEKEQERQIEGDTSVQRPYTVDVLRQRYQEAVKRFAGTKKTEKVGGMELWQMVAWQLREMFAGTDDQETMYHAALEELTGKASSKKLTGAECRAILQWLDPQEREGPGTGLKASKMASQEAEQLWQAGLLAQAGKE